MAYRPWFERFEPRFAQERAEMSARGFSLDENALNRSGRVEFLGRSRVVKDLELRVSYPDSFPSKPPHVFTPKTFLLKRHQRPETGEICTFGPSRGRWVASLSGTAAIDEAEEVIASVVEGQSGEHGYLDDVPEPASALYAFPTSTFILVPPAIAAFASGMAEGSSTQLTLRFENWPGQTAARAGPGRGVVTEIGQGREVKAERWHEQLRLEREGFNLNGRLVRVAAPPNLSTTEQFSSWLQKLGHERTDWMAFVFPEQAGNATAQRLGWVFVRSKGRLEPIRTFVMDGSGRAVRVPGLSGLLDKTVVLLGCGSLGSKIAASLAATGISHFGLVDFDFLEPDNTVRHESGLNLFGIAKVQALQSRLFELNPQVAGNVKMLQMVIGGSNDVPMERELHELLARASLVVDTTGDHGVSRFLNDICGELGIPQLYASVTNGAWSGEVVRVIPGRTACWMCWLDQYGSGQPPSEPAPELGVFAPGCDQPTFTGTSYDLGIVGGLASSVAVDTLLIDDNSRQSYQNDYVRWQMRNSEGKILPSIEVLPVQKREGCPFCNPS